MRKERNFDSTLFSRILYIANFANIFWRHPFHIFLESLNILADVDFFITQLSYIYGSLVFKRLLFLSSGFKVVRILTCSVQKVTFHMYKKDLLKDISEVGMTQAIWRGFSIAETCKNSENFETWAQEQKTLEHKRSQEGEYWGIPHLFPIEILFPI